MEDSKEEDKRNQLIQLLLKDQEKKCLLEFTRRMMQQLPFGERENRLKEILFEYFPYKEENDEFYLITVSFLTDSRGYGRGKEKFLSNLRDMLKVLDIEMPIPMVHKIKEAFSLPSKASDDLYAKTLQIIFTNREKSLLKILLGKKFSEGHILMLFTSIHDDIDLQLSVCLLQNANIHITEEQYLRAEKIVKHPPEGKLLPEGKQT